MFKPQALYEFKRELLVTGYTCKSYDTDMPKSDTLSVSSIPRSLNVWYSFLRSSSWLKTSYLGGMLDWKRKWLRVTWRAQGTWASENRPVASREALRCLTGKRALMNTNRRLFWLPLDTGRCSYLSHYQGICFFPNPPAVIGAQASAQLRDRSSGQDEREPLPRPRAVGSKKRAKRSA
jgi:hypothetical protein